MKARFPAQREPIAAKWSYPEPPECGQPCGALESLAHENAMMAAYIAELEAMLSAESVIAAKGRAFPMQRELEPEE